MARQSSFTTQRLQAAWEQVLLLPVDATTGGSWIATAANVAREQGVSMGLVAPMMIRLRKLREAGQEPSGSWAEDGKL